MIQRAKDAVLRAMVNTEAIMTEDVRQALIEDAMFTGMTSMSGIAIVHRCYGIRAPTRYTLHSPFPQRRTLFLRR